MLFETFCAQQHLDFEPIPTSAERTPDYRLQLGAATVLFEIEQIESLVGFEPDGVSSRTVGAHVRRKIADARKQVQAGSQSGLPAVLLIYNTVDSLQAFGTETHDFICAMYGELTVRLFNSRAHNTFHGRNATLRHDVNTSFSCRPSQANGARCRCYHLREYLRCESSSVRCNTAMLGSRARGGRACRITSRWSGP
jgi:hypothetical protein